jgi:hypothetical protein
MKETNEIISNKETIIKEERITKRVEKQNDN